MKSHQSNGCADYANAFFGSTTIGERGQVVIPAEARAELGFAPGDKLLVMRHPIHHGVMLFKLDSVREFLNDFSDNLDRIEQQVSATPPEEAQ